jgi:hypothetical protein
MGRESSITPEQVGAAAEAIKAAGVAPTLRAVRERLGVGSMGTINRMLQSWKDTQGRPATQEVAIPPALARAIIDHMGMEIAQAKAPLVADLAEARQATADLATENERQAKEIEDLSVQMAALAEQKAAADGRAAQLAAELAAAREEAGRERRAAEEARVEVAKAALRLEAMPRLEADLTLAREALETERLSRVAAEQSAAVALARLEERGGHR